MRLTTYRGQKGQRIDEVKGLRLVGLDVLTIVVMKNSPAIEQYSRRDTASGERDRRISTLELR